MDFDFSKLIVIIPTYNEQSNIGKLVSDIFTLYPASFVIIVDDNSPDGTQNVVKNLQSKFQKLSLIIRAQKRSFGKSYIDGFKKALEDNQMEYVIMMDGDNSFDPREIIFLINKLSSADLIIGSRYANGGAVVECKWYRKLLSYAANFYIKIVLGVPVKDMTSGFQCFNKKLLEKINFESLNSDGYSFLVEMKYKIWKKGLIISEHPVTFQNRKQGKSKMSFKVIWESIWTPWRLWKNC